jgi:hypothetical protein
MAIALSPGSQKIAQWIFRQHTFDESNGETPNKALQQTRTQGMKLLILRAAERKR